MNQLDQAAVFQRPYLIIDDPAVIVVFVELRQREGEGLPRPRVVAGQALRPAGEVPGLLAFASRGLRIDDVERAVHARCRHERGVGLLVVPLVRVAVPDDAVEMEHLCFQSTPAAEFAMLHLQRCGAS